MRSLSVLALLWALSLVASASTWNTEDADTVSLRPGLDLLTLSVASGSDRVELICAVFDARRFSLVVADNPGSQSLEAVVRTRGAAAGVNGGYFHASNVPVGLVISGGNLLHPMESAKLLSGLFAANARRMFLLRPAEFKQGPSTREALQSGPFLVDASQAVPGLNETRHARRTFVATDGKNGWALGVAFNPTLADLGDILATPGILPGHPIQRALNLDGGSSSGIFAPGPDKALYRRELNTVRNFLLVMPR